LTHRDRLVIGVEPYAAPDSIALVRAMADEVAERYGDEPGENAEYEAGVTAETLLAPHGVFLVARRDGVAVGCGAVRPRADGTGDGEIKRMYVVPGARRQGISRKLLAALEAEAAKLGYRALQLETGLMQPEAIALYESAGWQVIPSYGRYQDSPLTVCYRKEL
jgi:GNAT superfamily N-acetyltransferase